MGHMTDQAESRGWKVKSVVACMVVLLRMFLFQKQLNIIKLV